MTMIQDVLTRSVTLISPYEAFEPVVRFDRGELSGSRRCLTGGAWDEPTGEGR
jgi:hypothetical protein